MPVFTALLSVATVGLIIPQTELLGSFIDVNPHIQKEFIKLTRTIMPLYKGPCENDEN